MNYYVYIYQANKEGKFITKEQVLKEIKKIDIQNMSCLEQLDAIDDQLKQFALILDP